MNATTASFANLLTANVRTYLEVKRAFDECDPEIQGVIREMFAICDSADADDDEKNRAMATAVEALFPSLASDTLEFVDGIRELESSKQRESELDAEEAAFAERLKAVMESRGWTQERLAAAIGVGQPAISNMLNRQCRPQLRTVSRLAEALGVEPNELWPTPTI